MANEGYPTLDQLRDKQRKFHASRLEEEAKLRSVYGTPEDREHERLRVEQEWDKIEHDKAKGLSEDDLWSRHLARMKSMAGSLMNAKKAERRARHFELAGLSTAAAYFQQRADELNQAAKKPIDPQKDLLIDNLNKFNEFTANHVGRDES